MYSPPNHVDGTDDDPVKSFKAVLAALSTVWVGMAKRSVKCRISWRERKGHFQVTNNSFVRDVCVFQGCQGLGTERARLGHKDCRFVSVLLENGEHIHVGTVNEGGGGVCFGFVRFKGGG